MLVDPDVKTIYVNPFLWRTTSVVFLFILISACSNHAPAPVFELSSDKKYSRLQPQAKASLSRSNTKVPASYQVKPGDTLYSIAWEYGLDYKNLAEINQLKAYRIYPGENLQLTESIVNNDAVFNFESLRDAIEKEVLLHKISSTRSKSKIALSQNRSSKYARSKSRKNRSKSVTKAVRTASDKKGKSIQQWIWPTEGPILARYSARKNDSKGLDIAGKKGSPVRAAAPGRVVYSGGGLRGYGQLVIIKHNEEFLSAYAHNDQLLVEENEIVKAGQRIANVGSTGAKRNKLHFEIRFKGRPVDPLNYLPNMK